MRIRVEYSPSSRATCRGETTFVHFTPIQHVLNNLRYPAQVQNRVLEPRLTKILFVWVNRRRINMTLMAARHIVGVTGESII